MFTRRRLLSHLHLQSFTKNLINIQIKHTKIQLNIIYTLIGF